MLDDWTQILEGGCIDSVYLDFQRHLIQFPMEDEMYKYTHNMYQIAATPYVLDDVTSKRYNGFKIIKERCTHPCGRQFFGNCVNNTWNALLSEIIQATSIDSFKSRLDSTWKNLFTDVRTIQYKRNTKKKFHYFGSHYRAVTTRHHSYMPPPSAKSSQH